MDTVQKIEALGRAAQYDLCSEGCGTQAHRVRDELDRWIYPAVMPDGRRIAMLKVLLTNACENDCGYCAMRAGRDCRRVSFQPEELARLFDTLVLQGRVRGLFLSSSVSHGADRTMQKMIDTVEIVRRNYGFRGYVHLKILPGVQRAAVTRAVELADRVSLNLEAPSSQRLAHLSHAKDFQGDLLTRLRWARDEIRRIPSGWQRKTVGGGGAGITTQFVVGGAQESDCEILGASDQLYRENDLRRAYYSAFQPVPGTPLENQPPTPPLREHRLYQSDWLLRKYGFQFPELIFDETGNLPLSADPKTVWAQAHPDRYPMEVNRASREELLRIPGIGPESAARIVKLRRESKFHSLSDLSKIGAVADRACPYILLNGRRPPVQIPLL
jgi:predicted DNA-binding helix-hairpin-helix protein